MSRHVTTSADLQRFAAALNARATVVTMTRWQAFAIWFLCTLGGAAVGMTVAHWVHR